MHLTSFTATIVVVFSAIGVIANPVALPDPVVPRATVVPTEVADPVPEAFRTTCQKNCNQGYKNCIGTGSTNPCERINSLVAFTSDFCDYLRILCQQCCVLPNSGICAG